MSRSILQLVSHTYRCTLEEQDDPALWLTAAMQGAGGVSSTVVLVEDAVNYAVRGQDARGLAIGDRVQGHGPDLAGDVARLVARDVPVKVVREDMADRGLSAEQLVPEVEVVGRSELPSLVRQHDLLWHW